jgi:hypothetical protein
MAIETKLRYLDRRDQIFESVETSYLKLLRLKLSIKTRSRQIKTPRLSIIIITQMS